MSEELSILAKVRGEDAALCEMLRDTASKGPIMADDVNGTCLAAAARIEALSAMLAEACHERDGIEARLEREQG